MKQILLFFILLFNADIGFSQEEKLIPGKILSGKTALSAIDIVNVNSRASATTDKDGNFSILAKVNDVLFIISKEYNDRRIVLTNNLLDQENLIIYLEKKPIALEDVNITRVKNLKIKLTEAEIDEIKIQKNSKAVKVLGVNDGSMENAVDFLKLGRRLIHWLKKKDKDNTEKPLPPVPFKEYLASNFDNAFYTQKLKLKPDEIALFISFCEADPKAKIISKNQDILEAMDFLIAKNEAFKKLER